MDRQLFFDVLAGVASAWNRGDPKGAASFFTADALYLEPPDNQRCESRAALEVFFRRTQTTAPIVMTWHNLACDEAGRVGGGEYTFSWNGLTFHGVAVVELEEGLIKRWREYQHRSDLSWELFVGLM